MSALAKVIVDPDTEYAVSGAWVIPLRETIRFRALAGKYAVLFRVRL